MAGNNRPGHGRRVQGRTNGLPDLNAYQSEVEALCRVSAKHLHPTVPGKFDNCKKGAVQGPRAKVTFAIGSEALADFMSKSSGNILAERKFGFDIHQRLLISYHDIAYVPSLLYLNNSCEDIWNLS